MLLLAATWDVKPPQPHLCALNSTSPLELDLLYNSFPVYDADMTIEGYYTRTTPTICLSIARDKASQGEDKNQPHRNRGDQMQHVCCLCQSMQNKKNHFVSRHSCAPVTGLNSSVQTILLQLGALNTNFSSCPFPTSPPLWSHSFTLFMFH